MEANRDEAQRCYSIALEALNLKDFVKAEKMAKKSIILHPTNQAEELLQQIQTFKTSSKPASSTTSFSTTSSFSTSPKKRPSSSSSSSSFSSSSSSSSSSTSYTSEQYQLVKKINAHRADRYYEILEITKTASDSDIKKAYRKLALQLHPDKNSAPGADEAFKKVSKAFSVLSDSKKRDLFDQLGTDPDARSSSSSSNSFYSRTSSSTPSPFFMYTHSGSPDFDADELFKAFFGSNFPSFDSFESNSTTSFRTRTRPPRPTSSSSHAHQGHPPHRPVPPLRLSSFLWQFFPFFLIFIFSFFNHWLWQDPTYPDYSFHPSKMYSHSVFTSTHRIQAYVHEPTWTRFQQTYPSYTMKYFKKIEDDYIHRLMFQCERERVQQQQELKKYHPTLFQKLFFSTPSTHPEAYQRILNRKLAGCEKLKKMGIQID